jgi:hypothetical protein
VFEKGGRIFLLYAVAGESGIAIAEASIRELNGRRYSVTDPSGRFGP